jgi:hypothetical protein
MENALLFMLYPAESPRPVLFRATVVCEGMVICFPVDGWFAIRSAKSRQIRSNALRCISASRVDSADIRFALKCQISFWPFNAARYSWIFLSTGLGSRQSQRSHQYRRRQSKRGRRLRQRFRAKSNWASGKPRVLKVRTRPVPAYGANPVGPTLSNPSETSL